MSSYIVFPCFKILCSVTHLESSTGWSFHFTKYSGYIFLLVFFQPFFLRISPSEVFLLWAYVFPIEYPSSHLVLLHHLPGKDTGLQHCISVIFQHCLATQSRKHWLQIFRGSCMVLSSSSSTCYMFPLETFPSLNVLKPHLQLQMELLSFSNQLCSYTFVDCPVAALWLDHEISASL